MQFSAWSSSGAQTNLPAIWLLTGLWAMIFLYQAPIYTPLVISAILVAIAWRTKWWIGLPLIILAGYYAQITRLPGCLPQPYGARCSS